MSAALPKDQTVNAYDKRATSYETKWQAYLEHTHDVFLNRIETSENDSILDVSGGTGLLAQMLIDRYPFKQFIINDPSEKMLDIARRRLSDKANISFTNYQAENLPFEANRFDYIFCLNAFHFYTRQQHVVDQCYRMLEPGGKLYLLDWNRVGLFRIINQIIKWSTSEYINTRSLNELSEMLRNGGFRVHNTEKWSWRYWKFFFAEAEKLLQ